MLDLAFFTNTKTKYLVLTTQKFCKRKKITCSKNFIYVQIFENRNYKIESILFDLHAK